MAFTTTINIEDYINRGVAMLLANTTLRAAIVANSLVTNVLAQEPPMEVSPNKTVIPAIYVHQSKNTFRQTENIGRDSLDAAGAKYYHIEFYCLCIARGIDRQNAQIKVEKISQTVRDVFQKNLRMIKPSDGSDPICATNDVIAVPYVLRSSDPNIQAINVMIRPNVPVSLR